LCESVGVDQLVTQGAVREVGSLRDVENLVSLGLVDGTSSGGPELSENTEERTLTAAVRASNHKVHAFLDLEAHLLDESVTIRGNNWDINELYPVANNKLGLSLEVLEADNLFSLLGDDLLLASSVLNFLLSYHDTLVSANLEIVEDIVHLVNERSVTSKGLDFLVGDNETTDGFGQVNQERTVSHVILGDLGRVITGLGEVLSSSRSENGETDDGVTNHGGTVLD